VLDLAGGIAGQHHDDETRQFAHSLPRGYERLEEAGISIGTLADAGEMLDDTAKFAYRRRLSELREELEEAKVLGNVERAEKAEEEIDALTSELSRAVGLGGRNRRAASASERARQSIGKTIKSVPEKIAQSDARLGAILSRSIKTGCFCSYQPDPAFPIAWEFAEFRNFPGVLERSAILLKGLLNRVQKILIAEGLGEEFRSAGFHRAHPHLMRDMTPEQ
jgi:hypothetical protein